ncbi:KTSC domain-containing protein [Aeromicrobium phragmitis]|uniref:KTSC domain-containing protein n=1 Tax=Aeromicrobium phragmitis TaxID=2478914 RepID=A0A3L8PKI4_9ACTN|nr:KTSC domain-containing protein [Aeromicrobium phragmitis]RLV55704.1 KTSC domain-containing protein [Aeromicrobium phragmitis]
MKRALVSSSSLRSVGYDDTTHTLEVEFHKGAIYRFDAVPREVHDELVSAESIGRYFNENVRDAYPYRRLKGHR